MPDLIAHAAGLGFKMRMHSNGQLLTTEKLTRLWAAGLRQVLVSLDGPQHQHDWHRRREGLWPKTIAGIRNAVGLGFDVRVNSVATTRNVGEIAGLMPLVMELGAATFSVFYMIPVGRGAERQDLMVPPGRWRDFVAELRDAADEHRPQMDVHRREGLRLARRRQRRCPGRGRTRRRLPRLPRQVQLRQRPRRRHRLALRLHDRRRAAARQHPRSPAFGDPPRPCEPGRSTTPCAASTRRAQPAPAPRPAAAARRP